MWYIQLPLDLKQLMSEPTDTERGSVINELPREFDEKRMVCHSAYVVTE